MELILRLVCCSAILSSIMFACGCGASGDQWTENRPKTVPVSGVVMMDNMPLEGASISFIPEVTTQPAASGMTAANGKFVLGTFSGTDGSVPGSYRVTVVKEESRVLPPGYDPETSPTLPPLKKLTPVRYSQAEKSGFTATVTENGPNQFEFKLESK